VARGADPAALRLPPDPVGNGARHRRFIRHAFMAERVRRAVAYRAAVRIDERENFRPLSKHHIIEPDEIVFEILCVHKN